MWKIKIKTNIPTLKEINWEVEDYNSPEVKEVLDQSYVVEVKIEQIKEKELKYVRKQNTKTNNSLP